jgi:hypothetical protein
MREREREECKEQTDNKHNDQAREKIRLERDRNHKENVCRDREKSGKGGMVKREENVRDRH